MAATNKERGAVGHEAKSLTVIGNGTRNVAER
jgi:hypothetical protein